MSLIHGALVFYDVSECSQRQVFRTLLKRKMRRSVFNVSSALIFEAFLKIVVFIAVYIC